MTLRSMIVMLNLQSIVDNMGVFLVAIVMVPW